MPLPDVLVGIRQYLLTDADVASLVSERIFGEELTPEQAAAEVQKCITLKTAGGLGNQSPLDVNRTRIDVRCYGESPYEARQVYLTVYSALKGMASHIETDIKLLSAYHDGGPYSMRDPDTRWPFTLSSWMIMSREATIAS